jgi:hypothetical protein
MKYIEATSCGPEITCLLASGGGHVLAVVSNAIYLESYQGYVISIVGDDAVDGPLGLRVRNLPILMDAMRGKENLAFQVQAAYPLIDIAGVARVSLQRSLEWKPRLPEHLGEKAGQNRAAFVLAGMIATMRHETSGRTHRLGLDDLVRWCHSKGSEVYEMSAERNDYHLRFFAALRMTNPNLALHPRLCIDPEPRQSLFRVRAGGRCPLE